MEIDNNPNMEATPKTYPCKIYSKWMWSLENAEISITTPKGGTATVSKWNFDKCTKEQQELVCKVTYNSNTGTIELTREEIQIFHDAALASKGSVRQAWKPKPKSFMQRKFESKQESRRTGIRAGICGCGGSLRTKDHGTWVGYYCPQCKCGSSYNK